ncbi:MAG TPA: ABC transporter ATP-binding protein [Rhizobiales bacterium]|nr:ABC transporter ATP-binding protein [Hyphomicrobiales bacterium]
MSNVMLTVDGLFKSFGGVVATNDVCLDVRQLETHAIIGPNGAGKTTLVSQLSGSLKPDAGSIRFRDIDITRLSAHRRARLGLARSFQITSLVMSMSVLDNVALAVQAKAGHSFRFWAPARHQAALRGPAMAVLERVGLEDRAGAPVSSLSHGERRQVEIAVALAGEAELLLLDEPMAGMGANESGQLVDLLGEVKKDKTIVLIEHDMDAVFALADRISVLVNGAIIATGKPHDIRNNEAVRHAYLGEEA